MSKSASPSPGNAPAQSHAVAKPNAPATSAPTSLAAGLAAEFAARPSPPGSARPATAAGSEREARPTSKWRLRLPAKATATVVLPVTIVNWVVLALVWQTTELPMLIQISAVIATVAGTIVAGLFTWLTVRTVSTRLEGIAAVMRRLEAGDYEARASIGAHDEIGMLAHRVNRLIASSADRERRIIENALLDPLTGLPNRTLLSDRIRNSIRGASRTKAPFAIMVLDLDRFKFVNDTLGHGAGDVILKEVSQRLRAAVRDGDTVARLGGDEFVLMLTGGLDVAQEVATRIQEAMRAPLRRQDQLIDIGASIGIAMFPEHGEDDATLLRHADAAMYRAKRQQQGPVVFDGDVREVRKSYLSLLGEMRHALDRGQFQLDYQPKLELRSGLIVGVEGLVRWQHPTRGRIPPGEFIQFAEQTGFMREITRWVVAEGARFAAMLAQEGLDVRVSVNVAAQDIQNPGFGATIDEIIKAQRLDPKRLCLEITESGVVSEAGPALQNLNEIAKMGVLLSVDDFGTGYATLKQLQDLPLHELKIDRSFVCGLPQNRGNQSIVRATIDMSKQLGLSVVAEGVETVRELRMLASMGCSEVQGYYLAKPMAASEVVGWVQMRHALHASSREMYFEMLTSR